MFFVLTMCGLGLPVPEDILLITAGMLIYNNVADMYLMIFVSLLGVILGDYLIFMIGRKWGMRFLNHRVFMNAFSEKRMEKVHEYFDKYGNKSVFFARFIWGLRAATFFIAGTHTMNVSRFILLDFLGALISVPLIIYLAFYFGSEIEHAIILIKQTNRTLLLIGAIVISYLIVRHNLKSKKQPPSS